MYLTQVFHMRSVDAATLLNGLNGTTSLAPIIGAFLSDAYLGRYLALAIASVASLIVSTGTTLLLSSFACLLYLLLLAAGFAVVWNPIARWGLTDSPPRAARFSFHLAIGDDGGGVGGLWRSMSWTPSPAAELFFLCFLPPPPFSRWRRRRWAAHGPSAHVRARRLVVTATSREFLSPPPPLPNTNVMYVGDLGGEEVISSTPCALIMVSARGRL